MAEAVEKILKLIEEEKNFLLSGGAGSGKTYSLIEILKNIYESNPRSKVACITYTNSAVSTIKKRAPFDNLKVLTIHNFLWEEIKNFQKDLKSELVLYCEGIEKEIDAAEITEVSYREWRSLGKGVISHDEVLIIAERLFEKHKLLCDIVKDKYDFIFVDEYQDTYPSTINVLLSHLVKSPKDLIIGLFGDSMQSIYDEGVGDVTEFIESGLIYEVIKEDNFRCPSKVIEVINKIRNDGIIQSAPDIQEAKNYGKTGKATFLYSLKEEINIDEVKAHSVFKDFTFNSPEKTKELYLIHGLIASQAGFGTLYDIYNKDHILAYAKRLKGYLENNEVEIKDTDTFRSFFESHGNLVRASKPTPTQQSYIDNYSDAFNDALNHSLLKICGLYVSSDDLIGSSRSKMENDPNSSNKRDVLCRHLFDIHECIELYGNQNFNKFISKTDYPLNSVADKRDLKAKIEELVAMNDSSIGDVIEKANELDIWKKTDKLVKFIEDKSYLYNRVAKQAYNEWVAVFNYIEQFTIYSTQHSIKGEEYKNVFVMLDNGKWNKFNFKYLFENTPEKGRIIKRTRNLFYVCCSRAMENLVVFYHKPSSEVLVAAKNTFGEDGVQEI